MLHQITFLLNLKCNMATITPILKTKNNKRDRSILLRITVNRKSSRVSIGHKISTNDWDDENKKVRKSHPNSVRLNNIIQNYISKIDNIILQTEYAGKRINFEDIKEKIVSVYSGQTFPSPAFLTIPELDNIAPEEDWPRFGQTVLPLPLTDEHTSPSRP